MQHAEREDDHTHQCGYGFQDTRCAGGARVPAADPTEGVTILKCLECSVLDREYTQPFPGRWCVRLAVRLCGFDGLIMSWCLNPREGLCIKFLEVIELNGNVTSIVGVHALTERS